MYIFGATLHMGKKAQLEAVYLLLFQVLVSSIHAESVCKIVQTPMPDTHMKMHMKIQQNRIYTHSWETSIQTMVLDHL